MKSWVYEKGFQEGLREGREPILAMMAHVAKRRLGRPLSADERRILAHHLGVLSDERICDVMFDGSPEALAAWLSDPDAT